MFQTQYSKPIDREEIVLKQSVSDLFDVSAVRSSFWEEHCLECSAPQCFESCDLYDSRVDGRCKRFDNGIETFVSTESTPEGKAARVRFKPWGNLLTIIYPDFIGLEDCMRSSAGFRLGEKILRVAADSRLSARIIWPVIRGVEFIRRRYLRKRRCVAEQRSDAFILHAYSIYSEPFN